MNKIDYQKDLNQDQLKVVEHGDGYCLVLAGAGSGKTRTLVYRVAHLLSKGVPADQIMLVTFTNKAAREMLNRTELLWGRKPKGLWGGTYHHLGNLILRKYCSLLGYPVNFSILDRDDSRQLIKAVIGELGIKPDKYFPKPDLINDIISFAYNSQKTIEEVVLENYRYLSPDIISTLQTINEHYQKKKKLLGFMDFDDLLTNWYLLLRHPAAGEKIAKQFQYILVDEYQDTNKIQGAIVTLLARINNNLLVVGDDAQSIYSFRAATVSNILDFPKIFPGAKVFKLEINYRSTPEILRLANASINNNLEQFDKNLRSVKPSLTKPALVPLRDNYHQAEFIADKVLELHQQGMSLNDISILSRSTYLNIELELEINKRQIPYEVRGGVRFFEQAHIKDVLAYLRIIANPHDEIAWKRALNLQTGIGPVAAEKVWQTVANFNWDLSRILVGLKEMVLPGKGETGLKSLLFTLDKISKQPLIDGKIKAVLRNGYEDNLRATFENAEERIEDLISLAAFSSNYRTLENFLSDSVLSEGFKGQRIEGYRDGPDEALVLSTIHQAKGLEWKVVFIIGLVEGQFPHYKIYDRPAELAEERRLFYVAATRAKDELYLLYPLMGQMAGGLTSRINRPSTFISELNEDIFERWQVADDPSASIFAGKAIGPDYWRDENRIIEY